MAVLRLTCLELKRTPAPRRIAWLFSFNFFLNFIHNTTRTSHNYKPSNHLPLPIMPPAKKRKTAAKANGKTKDHVVTATASSPLPSETQPSDPVEAASPSAKEPAIAESTAPGEPTAQSESPKASEAKDDEPEPDASTAAASSSSSAPAANTSQPPTTNIADRMARFRALQTRAKSSSASNLSAAQTESHRLKNDPSQLAAIQRRSAVAGHKLLKAEIEDEGGDFERKRAWDWTVDESEKWDERQRKKDAHRDDNAFSDYRREANKVYNRQLRNLGDPDLEKYTADKMRAIEEAARRGTLEIVETGDGEMVAVDKDGTFYGGSGVDAISSFADNKPDKKAVDRLVGEMKKAEEVAAKKRRERSAKNGDDGDVTYINDKNSKFARCQNWAAILAAHRLEFHILTLIQNNSTRSCHASTTNIQPRLGTVSNGEL